MITSFTKKFILNLERKYRIFILILIDLFVFFGSIFLTNSLCENKISIIYQIPIFLIISSILIPIYIIRGHYKNLSRYIGSKNFYQLSLSNVIIVVFFHIFQKLFQFSFFSIKELIILFIISNSFINITKLLIRDTLFFIDKGLKKRKNNVAIYGAGSAGSKLAKSLLNDDTYFVKFFIDDSNSLIGKYIYGIPVISADSFISQSNDIDKVLLAIPSLNIKERINLLDKFENISVQILQIPSLEVLKKDIKSIVNFQPISLEDLLIRDIHKFKYQKNKVELNNSNIFISGAGGSIGSELCRQIIQLSPRKIILFDLNEENLYKINYEMNENLKLNHSIEIIPVLGDAKNINTLEKIFSKYLIDYIFHAAAYKHVPLVEINPIEGIRNNFLSTLCLTNMAVKYKINKFVLISSDKAVRPTSVMGLSKRLSELLMAISSYKNNKTNTVFCSVRFGNVIGSSGSVVPLFMKQISRGGPITLTDPKIERYFMTVQEASQLVIQASMISKGGEIFLLDMGKPIKIIDLASKIIKYSGLTVKNEKNPKGDIELKITGLRPGEKLYEELLVRNNAMQTSHPLIYYEKEDAKNIDKFSRQVNNLELSLKEYDLEKTLLIISNILEKETSFLKINND